MKGIKNEYDGKKSKGVRRNEIRQNGIFLVCGQLLMVWNTVWHLPHWMCENNTQ